MKGAIGAILVIALMSLFNFGNSTDSPTVLAEEPSTVSSPNLLPEVTPATTETETADAGYTKEVQMIPQVVESCNGRFCRRFIRWIPQRVRVYKDKVNSSTQTGYGSAGSTSYGSAGSSGYGSAGSTGYGSAGSTSYGNVGYASAGSTSYGVSEAYGCYGSTSYAGSGAYGVRILPNLRAHRLARIERWGGWRSNWASNRLGKMNQRYGN